MGCTTSRISDTDLVLQCKNRKRLMKEALNYRQDFAIAHIAYIETLKNIGVALRQFAAGDYFDMQTTPDTPITPILPFPQTTSSSVPPFSPTSIVSTLPLSSPSPPPVPHVPPVNNPPLLPTPLSSPPPVSSSIMENSFVPCEYLNPLCQDVSRSTSFLLLHEDDIFVSPDRSPKDSPRSSPIREESEDLFATVPTSPRISVTPPAPPSPPRDYAWDFFDFFQSPPLPFLSQQQISTKEVDESVDEGRGVKLVEKQECILKLKEQQKDDRTEEKDKKGQTEEMHTQVQPTEKVSEEFAERLYPDEPSAITKRAPEKFKESTEKTASVTVVKESILEEKENDKKLPISSYSAQRSLVDAIRHIDEQFIRACACGKDVAEMLEATKVRCQTISLDDRDSLKVFNGINWRWWSRPLQTLKATGEDHDVLVGCGMSGSHALTLERIYTWEKKLYEEVKAGELIRIAFDRKCEQLRHQDSKGRDSTAIDKTRATVKNLDMQLMVALRAIHLVSLRIQKLTNEELFPQLAEILEGLMRMWKIMLECHKTQKEIALEMNNLENSTAAEEITEAHRKATIELENELNILQIRFNRWIKSQAVYVDAVLAWLRLCHIEPETDKNGMIISPFWAEGPPIYSLLKNWHQALKRLQDKEEVMDSISTFSTMVHSLHLEQLEELQQKRKTEVFAKVLDRKTLYLQDMERRYLESPPDSDAKQAADGDLVLNNSLQERHATLNNIRCRVEEEKQKLFNAVRDRQDTTFGSLKSNLPCIFDAMTSFAAAALQEYEMLRQVLGQ